MADPAACPPASSTSGNARVIAQLLAELDALGVVEYCVAAGARNAPLLAVILERAEARDLTVRHFFEERCASFFALGRAIETRKPVAVITTSGTAVAELFPAVMEAYYQAAPLVVVTADRPSRYRGSGAPQAVEQEGIFTNYVVRTVELEDRADGCFVHAESISARPGPLHFNVCLEEDLVSTLLEASPATPPYEAPEVLALLAAQDWEAFWSSEGSVAVVAAGIHPEDVPLAVEFLAKLQAPIIAEATSNLLGEPRLTPYLLPASERVLKQLNPQRVLRLGAVPSWRWWRDLEDRPEIRVLNVSPAPFRGLARTENVAIVPWKALALSIPAQPENTIHLPPAPAVDRFLESHPLSEPAWMRHLANQVSPGATVFLGNSLPIREWNLAVPWLPAGCRTWANRGANGIDGLVSTWLGVAAEAAESWLIIGDLSTLYDLSAPWILTQLPPAKRRLVIINNGGGKIFSRVAWLKNAGPDARKVMENSHTLTFAPWAQMWGMDYKLITNLEDLTAAQAAGHQSACTVWEVRPDAEQTAEFWKNAI
jgi:2-succinyl-5-enolpyruvyl-6-hydroxy-3-cyclohexene-1-carboxylate synthase